MGKVNVQDKIISLTKYVESLKTRLDTVPDRRKGQEEVYKAWVNREIKMTTKKIEELKLV